MVPRRITETKIQRALNALMALVQSADWHEVDPDLKDGIHDVCRGLTRLRGAMSEPER